MKCLLFYFIFEGRDEISRAASHIIDGVKREELSPDDIDVELISQSLDLGEPELLVRTSGEVRLSDFMLWQVRKCKKIPTSLTMPTHFGHGSYLRERSNKLSWLA